MNCETVFSSISRRGIEKISLRINNDEISITPADKSCSSLSKKDLSWEKDLSERIVNVGAMEPLNLGSNE